MTASRIFPDNHLAPESQPWARGIQDLVSENESRGLMLKENSLADYQQINTAVNASNRRLVAARDFINRIPNTESRTLSISGVPGLPAGAWYVPFSETFQVSRGRQRIGVIATANANFNSGNVNPPAIFMYLYPGASAFAHQSTLGVSFVGSTFYESGQTATSATWNFDIAPGSNINVNLQFYCSSAVTFQQADISMTYTVIYGGNGSQ